MYTVKIVKLFLFFCLINSQGILSYSGLPKKVLIFSSHGGGGHVTAEETCRKLINKHYPNAEVKTCYPLEEEDLLLPQDIINTLTFGKSNFTEFYNFCLKHQAIGCINLCSKSLGPYFFHLNSTKTSHQLEKYISSHKPDIIISVMPMINYEGALAAYKFDIPYLVITLDNELKPWLSRMESLPQRYDRYRLIVNWKSPRTHRFFRSKKRRRIEKYVTYSGFPLKEEFIGCRERLDKIGKEALKEKYGIPLKKGVVMVMMGGQGTNLVYTYIEALLRQTKRMPIHFVACVGKNEAVGKKIKELPEAAARCSVIGFTKNIHELMYVSDLLITKPGGATVNEAISMKLPMFLDKTANSFIFWEDGNAELVNEMGIASNITSFKKLGEKVFTFFTSREEKQKREKVLTKLPSFSYFEKHMIGFIEDQMRISHSRNYPIISPSKR